MWRLLFGADGPDRRPPDLGPMERGGVAHTSKYLYMRTCACACACACAWHGMACTCACARMACNVTTSAMRREVGELRTYMSSTKHDACTSCACACTTAGPCACTHTRTHARNVLTHLCHLCHLHPSLHPCQPHPPTPPPQVFGPVLSIATFETEAEAVARTNDSSYGLANAVMSADAERCERVSASLEAGTVWINCNQALFPQTPFGGWKVSWHGCGCG